MWRRALPVCLLLSLLTACQPPGRPAGPGADAGPGPAAPGTGTGTLPGGGGLVTLRYFPRGHPEFDSAIVQAFEDAHGHIRVAQVTLEGDPRTKVLSLIEAGEVDVIMGAWVSLPELAQQHLLLDLTPFVQRDGVELQPHERAEMVEGRLYWLPVRNAVGMVFFNPDLLARAGVSPPAPDWTWDDFRRLAAALRDRLGPEGVQPVSAYEPQLLYQTMVYQQWREGPVPPPEAVERALSAIGALVADGLVPPPPAPDEPTPEDFNRGRAGFLAAVIVSLADGRLVGYGQQTPWDAVPFPRFPDTENWLPVYGDESVAVAATTPHPEAAWAMVRFMTGDRGAPVVAAARSIPPRITPEVQAVYREMGLGPRVIEALAGPKHPVPGWTEEDWPLVELAFSLGEAVMRGEQTPEEAAAAYRQAYREWQQRQPGR
ncbi:MAG: extracellular solute-binding protein [Bacillota bacterium]